MSIEQKKRLLLDMDKVVNSDSNFWENLFFK